MGWGAWRGVLALAVLACLGSGCSQKPAADSGGWRGASVRAATSTSVSVAAVDSFAVPADPSQINAAYAERVLNALQHVAGDVVRQIYVRRSFDPADLVTLRSIFNDPELQPQGEGYAQLVSSRARQFDPPGDNRITVTKVLEARPDCMAVSVLVDVSATVKDPPPPFATFVLLRLTQAGANPQGVNPTPWSIARYDNAKEVTCAS